VAGFPSGLSATISLCLDHLKILNLIDYAMAEAERVFIGVRFLLRERLQESRRRKIAQFIALTKIIPLRTHVIQ
jgi:hypothetical protein